MAGHVPDSLKQSLVQAVGGSLDLAFRPMFGGIAAYVDGKVFAMLSDVGLAFKLAAPDRDALLAVPGARPLQYDPYKPPSRSYVSVPDTMLADLPALAGWARRSARHVATLPAKASGKREADG